MPPRWGHPSITDLDWLKSQVRPFITMRFWKGWALWIAVLFCTRSAGANLKVDDPATLLALEARGFNLARLGFGASAGDPDNRALSANEAYRSVIQSLEADLQELKTKDPLLRPSMGSGHRLFDSRWLRSPHARFELVGILNRLDRSPFQAGSCGEFRLIYRLAYQIPGKVYSRLPLTVNLVFWAPAKDASCRSAARLWDSFLARATSAPKESSPADLPLASLKALEINLQSVRWPSTVRPDMGGYAEYLLRVFHRKSGRFELAPLENTPDVERLLRRPADRGKLLAWLREPANLRAIDEGIAVIPDEFLARKTTSVALHGAHRLANAPFTRLFKESDFSGFARSPHGLIRRLNDLTCIGCHQGRTVAGFHFLGRDRPETSAVNAIEVSASPHFLLDQARRQDFHAKVLTGAAPRGSRPLSVRAEAGEGRFGSHCGLGDPAFADWKCEPGFHCAPVIADDRVSRTGVCAPDRPSAGSACQPGRIRHHANPHVDRVVLSRATDCGSSRLCEDTSVGFPGGMCSGGCESLGAGEACGSIAVLQGFNDCLARRKETFDACLRKNVRPGAMRSCSEAEPCRDDAICARLEGASSGQGACIPPYFLFQLRIDGHPDPAAAG